MSKLNPLQVKRKLNKRGLKVFSPEDIANMFDTSYDTARKFIYRYIDKGVFAKLRQKQYILSDNKPHEFLAANKMYQPSYVSFESALSYHHIIPESIYTVTSATTKPKREFSAIGLEFVYYKIKQRAFNGYKPFEIDNEKVLIATKEKALTDYLYFVSLGKKELNERIELDKISQDKLENFVNSFQYQPLSNLYNQEIKSNL